MESLVPDVFEYSPNVLMHTSYPPFVKGGGSQSRRDFLKEHEMKMLKKVIGVSLLMPLMSFAASEKISDWGFEPNGELRAVVGSETVLVSPQDEAYVQSLMAARLNWSVELVNGHMVVDAASIPASQISAVTDCQGPSCSFSGVSHAVYVCTLDAMEAMIKNPPALPAPFPPPKPGSITQWPDPNASTGTVSFTMWPFKGPFTINVAFNEPTLSGTIVAIPTEPIAISYSAVWGYVEVEVNKCKAAHP
jgi:hypothetical protein